MLSRKLDSAPDNGRCSSIIYIIAFNLMPSLLINMIMLSVCFCCLLFNYIFQSERGTWWSTSMQRPIASHERLRREWCGMNTSILKYKDVSIKKKCKTNGKAIIMRSSMKPTLYQDFFSHTCWFCYRNKFLIIKLSKLPSFRAIQALIASQSMWFFLYLI